jgi:hypothetical protein
MVDRGHHRQVWCTSGLYGCARIAATALDVELFCALLQLLHHVCDRPPLCGIPDLDHFHVVRPRQDEAGRVGAARISARLKGAPDRSSD